MKLYDELVWRGMIKDVNDPELAEKRINEEKINFYIGYDPTGKSLTVGHLVQIVRMRLMQLRGHHPIVLIGGATGLIGDPRESSERKLLTLEESLENAERIKAQIQKYLDPEKTTYVNNYDWVSKIDMISFLRDYGKEFSINYMMAKDTIQKRLETGISYTEFSYMLIQAIDFLKLYEDYNCTMQFGGSDQWGNITTGLELLRKRHPDNNALGLSSPLLLKSDGTKFGKSEGGALWLDEDLTSPYELYQYFLNTADADVVEYLKKLTLLDKEEIISLSKSLEAHPELREAQKKLAYEVVKFVHGEEQAMEAIKVSEALFSGDFHDLKEKSFKTLVRVLDGIKVTSENNQLVDILVQTKLAQSKREAREFITNGAISVNDEKITDTYAVLTHDKAFYQNYLVIKRGRRKHTVVYFK